MKSVKIWFAITGKIFSPVCRDLGTNRWGSRQTGMKIFHIIAQQGTLGLTVAGKIKLFVHFFIITSNFGAEAKSSNLFWEFQSQMLLNISFSKRSRIFSQLRHIVNKHKTLANFVAVPGWLVSCNTVLG